MNNEDILEIKKTWQIPMKNPNESGQAILIAFFTQFPENQEKFDGFRNVPVGELKNNVRFKAHASRIIRLFDDTINALGTESANSTIGELWRKMAESHFRREISKQSFEELKGVILEILKSACELNDRQTEAWTKFLDHAYEIVFVTIDKLADGSE